MKLTSRASARRRLMTFVCVQAVLLVLVFGPGAPEAGAQTGTISGTVTAAGSGATLADSGQQTADSGQQTADGSGQ